MKKYNIIYADPPWPSPVIKSGSRATVMPKYNRMPMIEILNLPVPKITEDNCVLFMWVISSFLPEACDVIDSWGFKYKRIDSVWVKKKKSGKKHGVPGYYGLNDVELLLMGTRGRIGSKQIGKQNLYTAVDAEWAGVHSRKPQIFRDRIVHRFGKEIPKIELFAREKVDGWDSWGNEL